MLYNSVKHKLFLMTLFVSLFTSVDVLAGELPFETLYIVSGDCLSFNTVLLVANGVIDKNMLLFYCALCILLFVFPMFLIYSKSVNGRREYVPSIDNNCDYSDTDATVLQMKMLEVENKELKAKCKELESTCRLGLNPEACAVDLKVRNRTEEIRAQNEEILAQRDALEHQKEIIAEKNKDILASITYAKRIQDAMLVGRNETVSHFNDAFILYRPKDIISGDFYWFAKSDKFMIFAVADCTGHGVPGGVLTMMGNSLLNQIVLKDKIYDPAEILTVLDEQLHNNFRRTDSSIEVSDGMDISLCRIDLENKKLAFAGARNPLYYVRKHQMNVIRGTARSIGGRYKAKPFKMTEIDVYEGDMFYLFSDGYYDQFGGVQGKKFMRKRFRELLEDISTLPLNLQKSVLKEELYRWRGMLPQTDDILVAGFKVF